MRKIPYHLQPSDSVRAGGIYSDASPPTVFITVVRRLENGNVLFRRNNSNRIKEMSLPEFRTNYPNKI